MNNKPNPHHQPGHGYANTTQFIVTGTVTNGAERANHHFFKDWYDDAASLRRHLSREWPALMDVVIKVNPHPICLF